MIELQNPSWLSAAGIVWDFSGALAVSIGVFFTPDEKLRRLSGSYWGGNPSAVRGYCEQRREVRFGLGQLLLGFALQGVSALGVVVSFWIAVGVVAPIVAVWIVHLHTFTYSTARQSLSLLPPGYLERTLREQHYDDLPAETWERLKADLQLKFAEPEPAEAG